MFSYGKRDKLVTVQKFLRRITDLTTPNHAAASDCARMEDRYNRAIPTLLSPWKDNRVDRSRCAIVLTRDISDQGVGLIANHPFPEHDIVLAYWLSSDDAHEPWFFRGTIQRESAMGGGFWSIGVQLAEFMNENRRSEIEPLLPLAHKLKRPLRQIEDAQQNSVGEVTLV